MTLATLSQRNVPSMLTALYLLRQESLPKHFESFSTSVKPTWLGLHSPENPISRLFAQSEFHWMPHDVEPHSEPWIRRKFLQTSKLGPSSAYDEWSLQIAWVSLEVWTVPTVSTPGSLCSSSQEKGSITQRLSHPKATIYFCSLVINGSRNNKI